MTLEIFSSDTLQLGRRESDYIYKGVLQNGLVLHISHYKLISSINFELVII
jgi:hypothetical protein